MTVVGFIAFCAVLWLAITADEPGLPFGFAGALLVTTIMGLTYGYSDETPYALAGVAMLAVVGWQKTRKRRG